MSEHDEQKSAAEIETETRERIRAELDAETEGKNTTPAGQPIVVKHNKPQGKRTLIVCVLSIVGLAVLATGGDYLMSYLKNNDSAKDTKNEAAAKKGNTGRERRDMGLEVNPFALSQSESSVNNSSSSQPSTPASIVPLLVFDKASALTESAQTPAPQQRPRSATPGETAVKPVSRPVNDESEGIAKITGVKRLGLDPNLYIPVDRYIPCSLMRRFVSDVAGNISCMISEDVYSANNHVRLIPAGTIARGMYKTGTLKQGQGRMFIAWTELRTPEPDAIRIPLIESQVVGHLGESGIEGWIDNHWGDRFLNTILLSSVQDFASALAGNSPSKDRRTDYTENTRAASAEMAKTTLEHNINIPPTMYRNQGDVIGIMTNSDIDFSGVYKLKAK